MMHQRVNAFIAVDPYSEPMRLGVKIGPFIIGSGGRRQGPLMRRLPRNAQGKISRGNMIGATIFWILFGAFAIWFMVQVFTDPATR